MRNEYYNTLVGFRIVCMGLSNGSHSRGNKPGLLEDIFSVDPTSIHVNDLIELCLGVYVVSIGDSASFY